MASLVEKSVTSPVGMLRLIASDSSLVALLFSSHRHPPTFDARAVTAHPLLDHAARELEEYFRGMRREFSTPVAQGGTEFQRAVWDALRTISFGQSCSYGQLASMVGRPQAIRAVGSANGRNPISIFVPCHRVIGSNGELTGYAGGMTTKRWLLDHERAVLAKGATPAQPSSFPRRAERPAEARSPSPFPG